MLIKKNLFSELKIQKANPFEATEAFEEEMRPTLNLVSEKPLINKESLLVEAQREAELILAQAKEEAENILYSTEERVQSEIQQALTEKMQTLNELETQAAHELESFANAKQELLQDSKDLILNVAVELASKITNKKVKEDPKILESLFNEAMNEILDNSLEGSVQVTLIINPQDFELASEFAKKLGNGRLEILLKEDESISPGSCMIESPSGILDLNFSSQLRLFKEKMLSAGF